MNELVKESCDELWRQLVDAELNLHAARANLFSSCRNELVDLTRLALAVPHQRATALGIIGLLTVEERQSLLSDLLSIACFTHGQTAAARDLVLELPHQWLISNIEEAAERLLQHNDYEEYQGLFQIYMKLDATLAKKLAERAAGHPDADIQEVAQHFFERAKKESKL